MLKNCKFPSNYSCFKKSQRCGEIICHDDTDFTIVCMFCKIKIFEFDEFLQHYRNVHINDNKPPAAKQEDKCIKQEIFEDLEFLGEPENDFSCAGDEVDSEYVRIFPKPETDVLNVSADCTAGLATDQGDGSGTLPPADNVSDYEADFRDAGDDSDVDADWEPEERAQSPTAEDDDADRILKKRKPKDYPCEHCAKRYTTEKCLKLHVKMQHLRPKDFKCDHCDAAFNTSRMLESHIKNTHTLFPCPQCDRVYRSAHSLRFHSTSHKEVKDFICDFPNCGKAFYNKRRLITHMKLHTSERNFVCEVCGYRTRLKDALVIHKRSHTGEKPYECKVCGRRFMSSSLLSEHKAMHSSERPHVCDTCGAAFSRAKALYHHKHLHLGIKKFVCKLCGRAYAQMAGLSGHMRQHRMEDSGLLPQQSV